MANSLEQLEFKNCFVAQLPADQNTDNSSRTVLDACYSRVTPRTPSQPTLIGFSREVAKMLGIESHDCQSDLFKNVFSGKQQLSGMQSYATCYGGHQFGNWAGQLGDGRAINLGEIINQQNQRWALQLKGAGPTPYSRHSDGLAVLRSSLREFLCSESMYHLGVPTTRALSLCLTGDTVRRDMFYDGNPIDELGAVVCRVAPSFTRFGNFQIFAAQNNVDLLKKFLDYTISIDFPHLGEPSESTYVQWFSEVCQLTKTMIVHWMRVGFVHGVMNTDNMSILGLTIDYGPYGWLEGYDENWTPNTTDAEGKRYRYGSQPMIAHWNLTQLARAMAPLLDDLEPLKLALDQFCADYEADAHSMMLAKLGLQWDAQNFPQNKDHLGQQESQYENQSESDRQLISDLSVILQLTETDMTIFYRRLADIDVSTIASQGLKEIPQQLLEAYYQPIPLQSEVSTKICQWLERYARRAVMEPSQQDKAGTGTINQAQHRKLRMDKVNPKFVLRNYLAQLAIDKAETGDYSLLEETLEVMRLPYDDQPDKDKFAGKRPEWARHKAGCSMLSCSS